jgi:uncharacterized protein YodC (DUF2158 family)
MIGHREPDLAGQYQDISIMMPLIGSGSGSGFEWIADCLERFRSKFGTSSIVIVKIGGARVIASVTMSGAVSCVQRRYSAGCGFVTSSARRSYFFVKLV